jgi:DNA-binding NtrC family response regulator
MPVEAQRRGLDYNGVSDFGPFLEQASVLVVDDEPGMRNFLQRVLAPRCKRVDLVADVAEASRRLDEAHFDVLILDNIMPGRNGVEWLAEQRAVGLFTDTILVTAYADLDTAIQALRAGATDFVLKPFRSNQILNAIARCLDRVRLQRENFVLRHELQSTSEHLLCDKLIGESRAIRQVRETIARVAALPTSVLLTGQSGTGKEVAARALHAMSDRRDASFVPVNCAAIPPEMLESELFGHVKGAFTGAQTGRKGLFMHAQGGTLLLDEIGEMPLAMQGKLLRVLEDRRVRPVGSERELPVDVRLIFSTNADLEREVQKGSFRADLYFRLNVIQIHLPPLEDRENDVQELATLFMEKFSRQLGMPMVALGPTERLRLARYHWPGNVRELRNLIERTLILGRFPDDFGRSRPALERQAPDSSLAGVERRHIEAILKEAGGNREEAARRLGISRKTIDRKCAEWYA